MSNTRESNGVSPSHSSFIGLGSNVGDREKNLHVALEALRKIAEIKKISSLYETEPMEYKDQEWFLNMAVEITTRLKPRDLLKHLQQIEQSLGRVRELRYGPRTIDLDILLYGDIVMREKNLAIPHLRMHERAFVLVPLCEIAGNIIHPVLKKSIKEILDKIGKVPKVYKITM